MNWMFFNEPGSPYPEFSARESDDRSRATVTRFSRHTSRSLRAQGPGRPWDTRRNSQRPVVATIFWTIVLGIIGSIIGGAFS